MICNNYCDELYWQQKNWKYGKLLLIWLESATDNGLWQLFLPGCGPKNLPSEQQFNPLTCSDKLHWKETAVDELLNRDSILKLPAAKKDIFCSWQRFTTFETDILARLGQVPAGKVISYSALAGWAGYPRAARAVGRLMAKNPFPLFYP
jgi:O6-methylguanine-DNA--protein-cysteine methyltransferase